MSGLSVFIKPSMNKWTGEWMNECLLFKIPSDVGLHGTRIASWFRITCSILQTGLNWMFCYTMMELVLTGLRIWWWCWWWWCRCRYFLCKTSITKIVFLLLSLDRRARYLPAITCASDTRHLTVIFQSESWHTGYFYYGKRSHQFWFFCVSLFSS